MRPLETMEDVLRFGKYKEKNVTVAWVLQNDPGYLAWWRSARMADGVLARDVMSVAIHIAVNAEIVADPKIARKFSVLPGYTPLSPVTNPCAEVALPTFRPPDPKHEDFLRRVKAAHSLADLPSMMAMNDELDILLGGEDEPEALKPSIKVAAPQVQYADWGAF